MQNHKTLYLVIITGALLTLLIASATISSSVYAQNKFRAQVDSNNEVQPIDSAAEGVATFKLKDDAIKQKINITGITDVSGAQIFMGKIGQNADPIIDLLKTGEKTNTAGGVNTANTDAGEGLSEEEEEEEEEEDGSGEGIPEGNED